MLITAVGNDGDDDLGLLYPALETLAGHVDPDRSLQTRGGNAAAARAVNYGKEFTCHT